MYHPGETISGAIEFTLTESKRYSGIKVDFLGSAHVKWSSGKTHYVGNEKYVQSSIMLWSPRESSDGSIGPGSFSFPFRFIIPPHVPSSFGTPGITIFDTGYISYKIEGRVYTGAMRFDHKASAPIFITRLTGISGANQVAPVREVKRKQVGCLCCAAGDVEFVAKLPHTGYCVTNGDVIPLTVDVQNNSTRAIKMKARIFQRVSMFVRGYENVSRKMVAEISSKPIQPGDSYVWSPANWNVPAVPPTLLACRILRVDYILEVSAVIPNALDLSCDISLLLGNVPYGTSSEVVEYALLGALISSMIRRDRSSESAVVRHDNEVEEENFDGHDSSERDTLI